MASVYSFLSMIPNKDEKYKTDLFDTHWITDEELYLVSLPQIFLEIAY